MELEPVLQQQPSLTDDTNTQDDSREANFWLDETLVNIKSQTDALGLRPELELDPDQMSEPRSVPLPSEDFEPFLTEFADYDAVLEQSLASIQDLGISHGDTQLQSSPYQQDSTLILPEELQEQYQLPQLPNQFQSQPQLVLDPAGLPSLPPSSPERALGSPYLFGSSPYHLGSSPYQLGASPNRFQNLLSSPLAPPPVFEGFGSPGSPTPNSSRRFRRDSEEDFGSSQANGLGLHHCDDGFGTGFDLEYPGSPSPKRTPGKQTVKQSLEWTPIFTIPPSIQAENDEIIRTQKQKQEQNSKHRSSLPPGTVDEYVSKALDGIYTCLYPHCGRLFRRRYNLRSHIQTHLCDRPYACEFCQSKFVRPHDLRRHKRCHSSTKAFKCECGKGFSRTDALQRHWLRMICKGGVAKMGSTTPSRHSRSPENE